MLLVTGITGHSGRYFLQELIKNKYEGYIRCVIKDPAESSLLENTGLNLKAVVGDLNDSEFINEVMQDVDVVLHIASIFYSVNVIEAAVKHNVSRAILVHTTGIYSKYKCASEEYSNIEAQIKQIIAKSESPLSTVYLRPTMIYGNVNDKNLIVFIKMVDKLRLFPVIDHGKNLLQPVNGRDLGQAYYQVLCSSVNSGDYILSGEKPISMVEVFELISNKLKKKTKFVNVPLGLGVFMARCLKVATLGHVDYKEKIQRMGEDRSFPHTAAKEDFGYSPIDFEQGLNIEIDEYLETNFKGCGSIK